MIKRVALPLVVTAVLLGVWQFLSMGVLPDWVLPTPRSVWQEFDGIVLTAAAWTSGRVLASLVFGIVGGLLLYGSCHAWGGGELLDTQFTTARAVPAFALLPLVAIWFGFAEFGRLFFGALTAAAFLLAPLREAIRLVPAPIKLTSRHLGHSKLREFYTVLLPYALPNLLGPVRVTVPIVFTFCMAAEVKGAPSGLGQLVSNAGITFNLPASVALILVAGVLGILADRVLVLLWKRLVFWSGRTEKL